jgi:hypothetical protein
MDRWRNFAIALFAVIACLVVTLSLSTKNGFATTIIKSKSNIANNRAAPIGDPASGPGDVVVLCSSCAYPPMPEEGCLILMDNQTGEIWAYCDNAVVGLEDPKYLGKLTRVGKRIIGPTAPK